jgi:hypothetical protein
MKTAVGPLLLVLAGSACSASPSSHPPILGNEADPNPNIQYDGSDSKRRYPVGVFLPLEMSWQGYAPGSTQAGTVSLSDYADPDGSKGINALVISTGRTNCYWTVAEAEALPQLLATTWKDEGVQELQLLIKDDAGQPATDDTALQWKLQYGATWTVAADPGFTFAHQGTNGLPVRVLVNPRTMLIAAREEGFYDFPEVDAMAQANRR